MGKRAHLVRRFVGSLWPLGPSHNDEAWALSQLLPREADLWRRMGRVDRRHGVAVALHVRRSLGADATRPVIAAALLHDVGKVSSRLGVWGRTVATASGWAGGGAMADDWSHARGFTRRVGLYLRHADLGGDMLGLAGADPLTEAWARQHHLPPEEWTLDPRIGRALSEADED